MLRGLLLVSAVLMPAACGGSAVAPSQTAAGTFTSSHFTFRYTALDATNISDIATALEHEYSRILADLAVDSMPTVNVTFYTDHAALEAATRPAAGVVPSSAAGLVTSSTEIHLMSPNAPAWAPYSRMLSNLVHEFAHCVSMRVNARIPNNPRWLWESVAIYESGQSVDLRGLSYMTALQPPSFASMGTLDNSRVYEVGYSIAEFVVGRWGRRGLVDLINANGDTMAAVGTPQAAFEQEWFAFARQRYGF